MRVFMCVHACVCLCMCMYLKYRSMKTEQDPASYMNQLETLEGSLVQGTMEFGDLSESTVTEIDNDLILF